MRCAATRYSSVAWPDGRRPAADGRRDGVYPVMSGQPGIDGDGLQQPQTCGWPFHLSESNGAVEGDHGVVGQPVENSVQGQDLWPVRLVVRRGFGVQGVDRGLELVGPRSVSAQRFGDQGDSLVIAARSQRRRSCSGSGTSDPSDPCGRHDGRQ